MALVKYISIIAIVINTVICQNELSNRNNVGARSAFDQDLYEDVLDSKQCQEQLVFLRNHSLGLQFLDASAKPPSGISLGNWNDLGDYFQCLGINQFVESLHFQGKYCAVTVPIQQNPIQTPEQPDWPELPELPEWPGWPDWPGFPWPQPDNNTIEDAETFRILQHYAKHIGGVGEPLEPRIFPISIASQLRMTYAVCVPKVCTATEAINFVQSYIPTLNVSFNEYFCRLPNDKPFVAADYVAMSLLSLIGILLIASTSYDLYHVFVLKNSLSRVNPLFCSFSVYTNTRRFLTFNSTPGALECLDGIRAISMFWVIVGHTYSMTLLGFIHNMNETLNWITSFSSTWINSAPITVDTFFMLSGVLAVYTTVGKITRSRFIRTVHLFYINRLMRMFPLLATVLLLQASVFHHVSDGPFWLNVAHAAENCRTHWWSVLLHVQNYVNPHTICLAQTWYLSVDIQLYIVCPFVIVFLFGNRKLAWSALIAIILASLVSSSLYSFIYNFSAALANISRFTEFLDYVQFYYFNTLTRAPPFFVGMVYGYLLHLCRNKKVRISRINVAVLWFLSFLMMSFCIFSMYPVVQVDHSAQLFDNFLNAYMRAIWAAALGWLIFACVHGYGGPINWFLSLGMWKLPARLSYAMYLIHMPIIIVANGSWVKTYYFTNGNNMYRFMGDISLSFLAALILCIAIDAPFSTLQKLLLGGGAKRPEPEPPKSESRTVILDDNILTKTSL